MNNISKKLLEVKHENRNTNSVNIKWKNIQSTLLRKCKEELMPDRIRKKEWMTESILNLMEQRRKFKNINEQKYKDVNIVVRREIRKAKEKFNFEKCQEIEMLYKINGNFNLHKKIKEMTGTTRKN